MFTKELKPPETVDILIDAYKATRFPNAFRPSQDKFPVPLSPEAQELRERVGNVPFSPYWSAIFHARKHGLDLALFAGKIFGFAERSADDEELLRVTGVQLGRHFGEAVLRARIDLPIRYFEHTIEGQDPYPSTLAIFLKETTDNLDDSAHVSSDWLRYVNSLHESTAENLLYELKDEYITQEQLVREGMAMDGEAYSGRLGGRQKHDLAGAIGSTLGRYLPDIVVPRLMLPDF